MSSKRLFQSFSHHLFFLGLLLSSSAFAEDKAVTCTSQSPMELKLKDVLNRALNCSPDLIDFRQAHEIAKAETVIANQLPNPTLSYNADSINPHPNRNPQGTRKIDSSVRIDQLIELGGKAKYRSQAASAAEVASQYQLKFNERATLVAIELLYFDALSAQQRASDLEAMMALSKHSLDIADKRFKVGDISQLDHKKIALDIARADNDYQMAKIDFATAKAELAKALGFDKSIMKAKLSQDWPNHEENLPQIDLEKIVNRPDLLANKNRTLAAENNRQFGRALRIPDVTIGLQYNHQPVTGDPARGTINTYSVGLSVPLFLRHSYQGDAQKAEIEYYRAKDAELRLAKDAYTDIQAQETDLEVKKERLTRAINSILPHAEQIAEKAEFAYSKGAINVLDLIDARRSLRQAKSEATQIRADFAKSLSTFKLATEIEEKP